MAKEYYNSELYERVEWIDDSSANLVYASDELAAGALRAFAAVDIGDISQPFMLQFIPAKPFPSHPETVLQIRQAVLSDKKQPKARERSRFYLIHPEYDPATNKRVRGYRQRDRIQRHVDDPKYTSSRRDIKYDKNLRDEEGGTFNETFYDDDEASITDRRRAHDKRRSSGGSFSSSDGLGARVTRAVGKELFPDRNGRGRSDGRLRNRSASPARGRSASPERDHAVLADRYKFAFHKENRRKAQMLKASLRAQKPQAKELFPHKATHRRSDAFDAADETADLFANRMSVPFTDGSSDSKFGNRMNSGFSIRGSASRQQSSGGFSIKGAAKSDTPKELFPSRSRGNLGKELINQW